jgi:hypothetical protein
MLDTHGHLGAFLTHLDAQAEPLEGWDPNRFCHLCKSCWYGPTKGAIVPCTTCNRSFHQDCGTPKIKTDQFQDWKCAICSGLDSELCAGCGDHYTEAEVDDPTSMENNEMVHCSKCAQWWHQACHVPHLYPLPIGDFSCSRCTHPNGTDSLVSGASGEAASPREPRAQPVRPRQRKSCVNRVRSSGVVCIGTKIDVFWADDDRYYSGVVKEYDADDEEHLILYADGDYQWEDLSTMKWNLLSVPTFQETAHRHSRRLDRLVWDRV